MRSEPSVSQLPHADTSKFDERKGATWHCIVGRNFGSFVTHGTMSAAIYVSDDLVTDNRTETKHFLYMYIGPQAVLLWKTQ